MASRLELMGKFKTVSPRCNPINRHSHCVHKEQVNNSPRPKDGKDKNVPINIFRGILFDDWLRLFMQVRPASFIPLACSLMRAQYAFQLTKRGQYELADEVLRHVSYSNAYQNRDNQDTIHYALIGECH